MPNALRCRKPRAITAAAALAAAGFLSFVVSGGCSRAPEDHLQARVDAGLDRAVCYLVSQQSADGAWRSTTYGTLADGPTLTPPVLKTVMLAHGDDRSGAACRRAASYLRGFISDDGSIPPDMVLDYPVYTAALSALLFNRLWLDASGRERDAHRQARDAWLEYLRRFQLTERLGWTPDDPAHGGWGYAVVPPHRPQNGRPPFDSDLSSTLFAVGALRLAGVPSDDPVFRKALEFVMRCQNFAGVDAPSVGFDDGGFFLTPTNAAQNKAGIAGTDGQGITRYHSYGSATADGLRALLRCGLTADHPRVRAALAWLERHFTARTNPGTFTAPLEADRDAAFYYYCWSVTHAFRLLDVTTIERGSQRIDWRGALAGALLERQNNDGSWRNDYGFLKEDDPLIATALAAAALANCQAKRRPPAP